jgi:hypothetical protein
MAFFLRKLSEVIGRTDFSSNQKTLLRLSGVYFFIRFCTWVHLRPAIRRIIKGRPSMVMDHQAMVRFNAWQEKKGGGKTGHRVLKR